MTWSSLIKDKMVEFPQICFSVAGPALLEEAARSRINCSDLCHPLPVLRGQVQS